MESHGKNRLIQAMIDQKIEAIEKNLEIIIEKDYEWISKISKLNQLGNTEMMQYIKYYTDQLRKRIYEAHEVNNTRYMAEGNS